MISNAKAHLLGGELHLHGVSSLHHLVLGRAVGSVVALLRITGGAEREFFQKECGMCTWV
jgi:hypothetical protein